ncbi:MAG: CoA transferase subunit A [Bacteroidales bacterium]|jgi:acetate CoA/acetoacetate CoA-transferase alpha subunit|nr:CoA transferase subunit A [Bacteroidales bacterium]
MSKQISAKEAVAKIKDGMTIMVGGFLGCGSPEKLIDELVASGVKNLTVIANDAAWENKGVGKLFVNYQIKKYITSHLGTNETAQAQYNNHDIDIEFVPQGTLAERVRAGGMGLGGVLTPTGLGTMVAEGKTVINIDGKDFLLEKPLRADVAIIGASKADKEGNLMYYGTAQNFNPLMAMAADLVIAQADELVEIGQIEPQNVHVPAILVDFLVM